jgi:hypothetical protein
VVDYTHRDRRAHREVTRAFWTVVGVSLGLTGLALGVPVPYVGLAAVVALGVLGAVCVGWSDRLLSSYVGDLRRAWEGTEVDGFLRVEVASPVGLDRDARSRASPSPHARRRGRGVREEEREPSSAAGSDPDQP